jgi:EAL domain-containing protein (putative c-di-GMP-specific phosphodiesterase class I)
VSSPLGSRSPVEERDLGVIAAFQPIVDLRDASVVGYEALARPRDGRSPAQLFAAAREQGRLPEVDRACRAAALKDAQAAGLGAPFSLFLNADASALELDVPDLPPGGATMVVEISESALTGRPEAMLRTLTALRTRGWGVSLDDVGADSRSLALMPLLYPDVIKLDLGLLGEREAADVARVVTAVGAEAERRHAIVLAEGIDSEARLDMARAAGATLGQGFLLGEPAPLPQPLPTPGRALKLSGAGGDVSGPLPYQRVTNWKRPARGDFALADRSAALLTGQAAALGDTGMLLAAPARERKATAARYEELREALGFVGVLPAGVLEDTWTEVVIGPGFGACFVARCERDAWRFATSYDRELVVECALLLMAKLPQLPPHR